MNMKKKFKAEDFSFTYHDKRECPNCSKPIADQEGKGRVFCEKIRDENGKLINDCKSSYHRRNDKPARDLQAELIAEHKAITSRIDFLIRKKGSEVTTDDLDIYEIDLRKPVSYHTSEDGLLTSHFLYHTVVSDPYTNNHKISRHGI